MSSISNTISYLACDAALHLKALPARIALASASGNPRHASANALRRILRANRNTEYGREHHFGLICRCLDDERLFRLYEHSVPAHDYEAIRPYVDRMVTGESNILIPGKPLMYSTTSGTTSKSKYVPVSAAYLKKAYKTMNTVWLDNFARHRPKFLSGNLMVSVGKLVEGKTEDGTLCGSVSGLTAKSLPYFIRKRFAVPSCVLDIADYEARYYAYMRIAIEKDITYFVTTNPSTILELLHSCDSHYDEMVADIEAGTLSSAFDIPQTVRDEIAPLLKKNPSRAKVLREIKEQVGNPAIKDFWPNLQMLSTWKCGNTLLASEKVASQLPAGTFYQEIGFFATECRFGVVLDDSIDTVLFPHLHFYEFVRQEDMDKEAPRFYRLHELEPGQRYCLFITTYSGLYRYNMNDLVEVGKNYRGTPTLHFVQKVNGIVSITGEKLYEKQFVDAVHFAELQTGIKVNFFIGFAEPDKARYNFYYEFEDRLLTRIQASSFTEIVDARLMEMNMEYKSKRESFRLKRPHAYVLRHNAYDTYKKRLLAKGSGREGQFKIVVLLQDKMRQLLIRDLMDED